ncbi:MAG: hypothetical protein FWG99_09170 [Treponema sp.]|nr:hypothetical protein [Treponema sp.]
MRTTESLRIRLEKLADPQHYLFSTGDFSVLFPQKTPTALMVMLGRAVKNGSLERVCRGYYIYPRTAYPKDLLLFHLAARMRADYFCYLSLETVLSENGIISQIPLGCITLMTSGRSGVISCGRFGRIEFTHTKKTPASIGHLLTYDFRYGLWRASTELALSDLRMTGREKLYEFI